MPQASGNQVTLLTATTVVVANMVGTGVFGSLGFQVAVIPTGFPILLLWLLGGMLAFCGAVCYAELGSMMPRSGGEYHLLSETWHPLIGFLSGWISLTIGFAAPVALNASLMGGYFSAITGVHEMLFSIPVVLVITAIHLLSLAKISRFQIAFTALKIFLIVVLIGAAVTIGPEHAPALAFLPQSGDGELIMSPQFATSLIYVLYAYTGWNAAIYIVGELKNPSRNLPLAMLLGTGFVTVLYVLLNAVFFRATPIEAMAGEKEVGLIAAQHILGERGGSYMGILIGFGLISTISSMTWAGPRVTAAIGEDYRSFRFFANTNRSGIPARAVILQAVLVIIMLLVTDFESLIHYVQAILTLASALTVAGVLWLRYQKPDAKRPYKAWGYPVTPLVFVAFSSYVLWFEIREKPIETLCGLATLVAGAIVYWFAHNRRGPE